MTIGLTPPSDFPFDEYEAVHSQIANKREKDSTQWDCFSGGWNAVAYRFVSCAEHDEAFTQSVVAYGVSPSQPHRFVQEKELFGFFLAGQSALESFGFAVYAVAAMVQPAHFPVNNPRKVKLHTTAHLLGRSFSDEPLEMKVRKLISDPHFRDWKKIRNILVHTTAPGRQFHIGSEDDTTTWQDIEISASTTSDRRKWLASTLRELITAAKTFTVCHFA